MGGLHGRENLSVCVRNKPKYQKECYPSILIGFYLVRKKVKHKGYGIWNPTLHPNLIFAGDFPYYEKKNQMPDQKYLWHLKLGSKIMCRFANWRLWAKSWKLLHSIWTPMPTYNNLWSLGLRADTLHKAGTHKTI